MSAFDRDADLIRAWGAISRFQCMGAVLQLDDLGTPAFVRSIQSRDARSAVTQARKLGATHVVVAGQLLRKKAGVFAGLVFGGNVPAVCCAAVQAHERLGDLGETDSLWIVLCDDKARGEVMDTLTRLAATEGSA